MPVAGCPHQVLRTMTVKSPKIQLLDASGGPNLLSHLLRCCGAMRHGDHGGSGTCREPEDHDRFLYDAPESILRPGPRTDASCQTQSRRRKSITITVYKNRTPTTVPMGISTK